MNFSRQALLGIGMIIGGSVMLYAMVQQIGTTTDPEVAAAIVEQPENKQPAPPPLTTDIDTEKRLLAQKQKERAARAAEQQRRAREFSAEQESAEAKALAKSQAENEQYIAKNTPTGGDSDSPEAAQPTVTTPKVQPRVDTAAAKPNNDNQKVAQQKQIEAQKLAAAKMKAEAEEQAKINKQTQALSREADRKVADAKLKAEAEKAAALKKKQAEEQAAKVEAAKAQPPKSASDYKVKNGDALSKIARQHNVSVSALAQANKISSASSIQIGQTLTIPSAKQVQRLEREAAAEKKAAEDKRKKEEAAAAQAANAQKNLIAARQEVKDTDAKGSFGVQVALATNQSKANEVVKKYEAAGYKVKTVNVGTGRGVRVIVGPERGKIAALALKDKVNSDASVGANGAWVRYWD